MDERYKNMSASKDTEESSCIMTIMSTSIRKGRSLELYGTKVDPAQN